MSDKTVEKKKSRDIGFTFVEEGTKKLPTGQEVPRFKGTANNVQAHEKAMRWIEEGIKEEEGKS